MTADVVLEDDGGVSFDIGTSTDRVLTIEIEPSGMLNYASLIDGVSDHGGGGAATVLTFVRPLLARMAASPPPVFDMTLETRE